MPGSWTNYIDTRVQQKKQSTEKQILSRIGNVQNSVSLFERQDLPRCQRK